MKYAEVILPLPLANSFTYRIPDDLDPLVTPGCRVVVHFGKRHYYTALILSLRDPMPSDEREIKEIYSLLDTTPIIRPLQLRFWEWMSSYYICQLGDVYKAALPSGLKLESETVVMLCPDFEQEEQLRPTERAVLDAFHDVLRLTLTELEKRTGLRNIVPIVNALVQKGIVQVYQQLKQGYQPKKQLFIRLSEDYQTEEALCKLLDNLKRAKKQERLLLLFLDLTHAFQTEGIKELSRKRLLEQPDTSAAALDGLLKRGVLEAYEKEIGRLSIANAHHSVLRPFSEAQARAYAEVQEVYREKTVCLLHGVTSSGKTELYAHLIEEELCQGRQVLYLLPEIAITTQIMERLGQYFGDRLLVYHSKFSDNERVEIWNRLLRDDCPVVVLGVRSSLFLPFAHLGLVIVDEEHESSYKQQDPAPRYHARNAAVVLAQMHGAKVLLGSATPSIESYFNATIGKYGLVELKVRYGERHMPDILTVNTRELRRKRIMRDTLFSPLLIDKMRTALDRGEQVILFQNRRGFAPMVECRQCAWVPRCPNCDVSLTYHKAFRSLTCHYCGYTSSFFSRCPDCGSEELRLQGFGTEQVEEEVSRIFPDLKVERLDMDTVRTRLAYDRIIADFAAGRARILIGTQMISKGLDFSRVSVVGILNADGLMNFPDFRAHERAFQLMVQVSGRAGRGDCPGVVILQTSQPDHPLLSMVQRFAYKEMVHMQLAERSQFRYPPYYRMILIVLRSKNDAILQEMAHLYANRLRRRLGDRVLGPITPSINRIQSLFLRQIVLKIEINAGVKALRSILEEEQNALRAIPAFRSLLLHYDVDPL